jgi:membrane fusion protein (multidrug efflux system)
MYLKEKGSFSLQKIERIIPDGAIGGQLKTSHKSHFMLILNFLSMIVKKLLYLLLIPFVFACESNPQTKNGTPPKVTTITIIPKDVPIFFEYIAITESSREVNIQARINGFLDKRIYTEGEWVEEGEVLFVMDKKPFIAQVNAAKAALERQKAALETAKLNLDRTIPLAKLNALSQKDLDDAKGRYDSAQAAVSQSEAELETAELNLSYCTIASPLKGITSNALQQDGTYLNFQNSLLTTVSQLTPIWVNFSISESELHSYKKGVREKTIIPPNRDEYQVEVILVDGTVFPYRGQITFTQPFFNPQTGTFLIRSSLENPDGIIRPNQYVRVKVHGAMRPNGILVPQRAVHQSSKGHYVFVVNEEGKAVIQPVVVGPWIEKDWLIHQGLQKGDKVIVDGAMRVQTGEKVDMEG